MPRALLVQLARLGDLLQSLPVISALQDLHPDRALDLLCPYPLVPAGKLFPGIFNVYPWDSALWQQNNAGIERPWKDQMHHIQQVLTNQEFPAYSVAYNLNNHPRSILAAHLLGGRVIGPGAWGPVNPRLSPWDEYLQTVARHRGTNRIHLSDAFCGLCQVKPPKRIPRIVSSEIEMPFGLKCLGNSSGGPIIGLALGAGDPERRIPVTILRDLIQEMATTMPDAWIVLLGGEGEREIAFALESGLSSFCLNRLVNLCGKTSLLHLVAVLSRCHWVVASDTGPLHMGAACGARAVGWYFARARVHETGPYGVGHYVWQHKRAEESTLQNDMEEPVSFEVPCMWPVRETIQILLGNPVPANIGPWTLWESQYDELGTYYQGPENPDDGHHARRTVWERLSPELTSLAS